MRFWTFLGRQKMPAYTVSRTILGAIFAQNPKKGIKKGMQKTVSKKYRKLMPKVIQNNTKMDTQIEQFSNFSEKG